MTQAVSRPSVTMEALVPKPVLVTFVAVKVTLGQVFSEYFCFPCQ